MQILEIDAGFPERKNTRKYVAYSDLQILCSIEIYFGSVSLRECSDKVIMEGRVSIQRY